MMQSTADKVLAALENYDVKDEGSGNYRSNSPLRPNSNSHAFTVKIDGPEYGTWHDHVSGESGSLYTLAPKLGINVPSQASEPTTKRSYANLTDYAAAHHAPLETFTAAGWRQTMATDVQRRRRPALAIPTKTGARYRFLDGDNPPFHSPGGYKACWYMLDTAIELARESNVLILCNGEPSTVTAQHYQVPATCITGSGERPIPNILLAELKEAWSGPIIVVMDCDDKGRAAAPKLVKQLALSGFDASAIDMRAGNGFDLADWCGLHEGSALADLLACQAPDSMTPAEQFHCTDYGNARRLVAQHGADLRYVKQWGWLVWDGRRWRIDDTGEIERRAQQTAIGIYQEAADAADFDQRKSLSNHARASESSGKIKAMIELAESQIEVRATPDSFDTNDWLLSCANGTLDLHTGELRPHDRADMLTKMIGVAYDPEAQAPRWAAFLDRIFAGNQALISYVQRVIGYTLTGSTGAQAMFIAHGTGANGKSVLIDVVRALLGDYARNADPSTFLIQNQDRIRSDIARLTGVRFVSTVELDEGRRLSEALVKQVTGGDKITARFLHHDEFEFMPRFKLIMATNHKPIIRGTDYAIWRRIRLIPFTVTIPEAERDPRLADKLKAQLPGTLAWAVQGCLDWQRTGLQEPTEVSAATNAYKSEMDVIGQFMDESTVTGAQMQTACSALYAAYAKWADDGGERPVNQRRFGAQMTERGIDRVRTRNGWVYAGIGLVTARYDEPYDPTPAAPEQTPQVDQRDPCDPCDLNSRIFSRENITKEKPGKLDHMDHKDHAQSATDWTEDLPADLPRFAARVGSAGQRRADLMDEYERLIGPLTATLTIEELEEAVNAQRRIRGAAETD